MKMTAEQVFMIAGDGRFGDGTVASAELREFLGRVPTESLRQYAEYCLSKAFDGSGFFLQDLVNEVGRRLGFQVENGLYRGHKKAVGFDGVWRSPGEEDVIVEVNTTSSYTIDLNRLWSYKTKLLEKGDLSKNPSFLIVVGRDDTNSIEAQIRGSRFAWDMRLISVEALISSVQISEKSDDGSTARKIRQFLKPVEYTRVDKIIELVFETATEIEESIESAEIRSGGKEDLSLEKAVDPEAKIDRTPQEQLDEQRRTAVEVFAHKQSLDLAQVGRRLFLDAKKDHAVCCLISKKYPDPRPYLFGFSPKMKDALEVRGVGTVMMVGMGSREAYAIPYPDFEPLLADLSASTKDGRVMHGRVPIGGVGRR